MKRSVLSAALMLALMLAFALSTGACAPAEQVPGGSIDEPGEDVVELGGVEVREYEGERLDSVQDFRENSIKGPQYLDEDEYRLEVKGLVRDEAEYTYSEIASGFPAYEKVVQLDCVEGWSVKILWRGVLVREILDKSGVEEEAQSVIFTAADGYSTSFPVEYFYDNDILMAYGMNGVKLPPERGFPFQLVAEDKWGYKWCKWIVGIELSAEEDPGGFWEDRGYNNSGDRDRPFFAN